jgi:hypothetical protein
MPGGDLHPSVQYYIQRALVGALAGGGSPRLAVDVNGKSRQRRPEPGQFGRGRPAGGKTGDAHLYCGERPRMLLSR